MTRVERDKQDIIGDLTPSSCWLSKTAANVLLTLWILHRPVIPPFALSSDSTLCTSPQGKEMELRNLCKEKGRCGYLPSLTKTPLPTHFPGVNMLFSELSFLLSDPLLLEHKEFRLFMNPHIHCGCS